MKNVLISNVNTILKVVSVVAVRFMMLLSIVPTIPL